VTLGYARFRAKLGVYDRIDVNNEPVRARNRLAAIVLRDFPSMRAVLWLDDDTWAEDPSIIQRMLNTREDLIGAPYIRRAYPLEWVHAPLRGAKKKNNVLEVAGLGFGFTITSRACLEEMTLHSRVYTDEYEGKTIKVGDLFDHLYDEVTPGTPTEDDRKLSEDLSFCARWRKLGHRAALWLGGPGEVCHSGGHVFTPSSSPSSR
jgi:hypothetical protein